VFAFSSLLSLLFLLVGELQRGSGEIEAGEEEDDEFAETDQLLRKRRNANL
jgi:hypothetical protein